MRTSATNFDRSRPTVTFYQIVRGWKDSHGKERVTQVDVRTARKDAETVHRTAVTMPGDFVRLYEVHARTSHGNPEFVTRLVRERRDNG